MKQFLKTQLTIISFLILFTSCAPSNYYQLLAVSKTNSTQTSLSDDLEVINYFWSDGGTIVSQLKNTTDKTVYLDLANSHLVVNGFAYTYYKASINSAIVNRSSTSRRAALTSSTSSISLASQISTEASLTIIEQRIVVLPPHSTKTIVSSQMRQTPFRDCDILLYPRKQEEASLQYEADNSPFVFRTLFAYGYEELKTDDFSYSESDYYVSNIKNYPSQEFVKIRYAKSCGKKTSRLVTYFPLYNESNFYIKY